MNSAVNDRETPRQPVPGHGGPGRRRYSLWAAAAVVAFLAFLGYRAIDTCLSCRAQTALTTRLQQQQAEIVAARIDEFLDGIATQMRWLVQMPWDAGTLEEWQLDSARLLRQVPAIMELGRIDAAGREQARVSRIAPDVVGSQADFSGDPTFKQTMATKRYYGPVYFRRDSEPYVTVAVADAREANGVIVAEVNLKFLRDLVSDLKLTDQGTVFAVDSRGRLIAHPDLSLVLRNIDFSQVAVVRGALARTLAPKGDQSAVASGDERALTMSAPLPSLGGILIVCRPKPSTDPTISALCDPPQSG